jgi:hypothetical protein
VQDDFQRCFSERRNLDSAFLDRVWPVALGRVPDEPGRQLFLGRMAQGTSRLVIIEDLLTSVEYNLHSHDDATFCRHLYQLVLCRDPHFGDTMGGWLDLAAQKGREATFQAFCTAEEVDLRYNLEDSWDAIDSAAGRMMVTFRRFDARVTFGIQRAPRPLVIHPGNIGRMAELFGEAGFEALSFRLVNHLENPVRVPWPS